MNKSGSNPYRDLGSSAFWRTGVVEAQKKILASELYVPKYLINKTDKIVTAGSCFAQNISRSLAKRECGFLDYEKAPPGLSFENRQLFGFSMYSARYGNIYTPLQLYNLLSEAFGVEDDPLGGYVFRHLLYPDRYIDINRPNIEPEGFASIEALRTERIRHLNKVKKLFLDMNVFIFTLGLVEYWECVEVLRAVPMAPGILWEYAGPGSITFRPAVTSFDKVLNDLNNCIELIRRMRKSQTHDFKVLLTVSPVPLTATSQGKHVLIANTEAKSTLRAAASEFSKNYSWCDYFPSYEYITNPACRSNHYNENLRTIRREAVADVMKMFYLHHPLHKLSSRHPPNNSHSDKASSSVNSEPSSRGLSSRKLEELQCEESMYDKDLDQKSHP
jgi:hypothetical protein